MKVKEKDIWRYGINDIEQILFDKALTKTRFNHLWQYVIDEVNIICSIKIIGSNKGKKTAGPDGLTFNNIMKLDIDVVIKEVKNRLFGSKQGKARRVMIPKSNGKMRPLGITNLFDRIAQQCVRNILEPILEAHFNPESFGFRKNRNAQECMSYIATTLQYNNEGHIYDCDLKEYFDTVQIDKVLDKLKSNHNIHDLAFLKCIKRLMWIDLIQPKEKYNGIGLRQGTILGPILANVMFHDFELRLHEINDFKRDNGRQIIQNPNIHKNHGKNYKRGREFYFNWLQERRVVKIIRYADDFVLISKGKYDIYDAIMMLEDWCKENGLEINRDKTKLIPIHGDTQLEFLGFKYRKTNSTKQNSFIISVKDQKKLWKETKRKLEWCLWKGNLDYFIVYIRGIFNYYNICTNLTWLISRIQLLLIKKMVRRREVKIDIVRNPHVSFMVNGQLLDLWEMRKHSVKSTTNYMYEVHKLWEPNQTEYKALEWLNYFFENRTKTGKNSSNIIYIPSLLNQHKKEPILDKEYLTMDPQEIHIHHKIPKNLGGTDSYNNLVMLSNTSHKFVHDVNLKLKDLPAYINLKQLNKYRKLCGYNSLK
ncbi:reverse transcriptase domain-containing protein [Bacillus sp. FJAT-42315]|uniref:reverse transcriptase domain-containing protein n=1 Tax=Bacillus sp. FJAT-42315 TaxID=2014077 RepID=UPI0018E2865D|nr:reverse transcriptase domain-containing protein [Bacillus sp. FJAT-42315]